MVKDYNQKQLAMIIETITSYEQVNGALKSLIDDLDVLIEELNDVAPWFQSALSILWSELEEIYTNTLLDVRPLSIQDKKDLKKILSLLKEWVSVYVRIQPYVQKYTYV